MRSHPLRVAVTRDEPRDGPLHEALRRAGLEPVGCAVIRAASAPEPERLAQAARQLESYDWLVAASARAVVALSVARNGKPLPEGLRTAAVGASTAAKLVEHGAISPLRGTREGAQPLIRMLKAADDWAQRRVLLPRAQEGSHDLGIALRAFGARVDEVVAYCTMPRPADEIRSAWRASAADAVVIASPSAARALVHAVGADAMKRLDFVVAIGTTTAMALSSNDVESIVPPHADFKAVAELLCGKVHSTGRNVRP